MFIAEAVLPVVELALQRLVVEPLALPQRIVGILDRQFRQVGLAAVESGLVEGGELAHEDVDRPAVGDDVVHGEVKDVLLPAEMEELDPQQRSLLQVEGRLGGAVEAFLQRRLAGLMIGDGGKVVLGPAEDGFRLDDLPGHTVDVLEPRAQALVSPHQAGHRLTQGTNVQRAFQTDAARHHIGRRKGLQPP